MESFSEGEILALAKAFPPVRSATTLLSQAGIPLEALPNGEFTTALEYWSAISRVIANGIVKNGRRAVLNAAHKQLPYNDAFLAGEDIERVLVIGANPDGGTALRADQELRAIQTVSPDRISVHVVPAAQATDLEQIASLRPHVLHFACHGDGQNLLFQSSEGRAKPVRGQLIADVLRVYRDQADVRLRGVILNACHSAEIAPLFADVADVVIAHHGPLSDGCAVIFASKLYGALAAAPSLAEAAIIAAENTVLEKDGGCSMLRDNLRVVRNSRS